MIAFNTHEAVEDMELLFTGRNPARENLIQTSFSNRTALAQPECARAIINACATTPFLVVFDECDELLVIPQHGRHRISLYRALRRALHLLLPCKLVAVCLGIKSSLDDFGFSWKMDTSLRIPQAGFLIPPYRFTQIVDVQLINLQVITYQLLKPEDGPVNPEILMNFAKLCGRPLWSCYDSYSMASKVADTKLNVLASEDPSRKLPNFANLIILFWIKSSLYISLFLQCRLLRTEPGNIFTTTMLD